MRQKPQMFKQCVSEVTVQFNHVGSFTSICFMTILDKLFMHALIHD